MTYTQPTAPANPADLLLPCALAAIVAVSVLGGAADGPAPLHGLAELVSLGPLMLGLRRLAAGGALRPMRNMLILLAAIAALPLAQLVPLPPAVWMRLPGREAAIETLRIAGLRPTWLPLSLAPDATLRCALALIPPVGLFVAGAAMTERERRLAVAAWLLITLVGLALGAAQLKAAGPYLYAETARGTLTGFFANRNHFATVLVALVPLAAALATHITSPRLASRTLAMIGLAYVPLAVLGLGAVQSRAGVVLAAPALIAALVVAGRALPRSRATVVGGALALAFLAAAAALALPAMLHRFQASPGAEFRFRAWPYVTEAALRPFPAGAGMGAFTNVYPRYEPLSVAEPVGFDHAHNEYLELLLETGAAGVALFAAFAAWLAQAGRRAWREGGLAAASLAAVLLVLALAATDYSLRTLADAAFLAFACGLIATPGRSPNGGPFPS